MVDVKGVDVHGRYYFYSMHAGLDILILRPACIYLSKPDDVVSRQQISKLPQLIYTLIIKIESQYRSKVTY